MKIAIITPGGVDRSGTERVIPCLLWLIERLVRAGHVVHIFAFYQEPTRGRWPLLGATVHNAGPRPRLMRLLLMLLAEHRVAPFDIVHAFWAMPSGVLGAAASRLLRLPLVLTLAGGEVASHPGIGYGGRLHLRSRLKLRLATAAADAITVPSETMRRLAADAGIVAETIPLGVALDEWPPLAPRPRDPSALVQLLHVGSLNLVKDQTTLLQAAALLNKRGLAFSLDLFGCDTRDGADERLACNLGLAGRVRFHGFLPHRELRPWFEHSDLLVVSSVHEAGPLVTLEAAVAGVPTVGTLVGNIADLAPEAAVAVPVGDAAAMSNAIYRLAMNEPERLRLAWAAQSRALHDDADHTYSRFRRCYEMVVTNRVSRRSSNAVRRFVIRPGSIKSGQPTNTPGENPDTPAPKLRPFE